MFYRGLGLVAVSSDKLTTRWKLDFSASHWLFWPLRGLRDVSHVWDNAHWIPGQILTHFDPSHLSVGQITRKLGLHSI